MEIKKVNLDRKNLTSTYIEMRQDFKPILNQARNTKMTDWKSPWFYGAIGLSSMALTVIFNNESNSNTETNGKITTLNTQEKIAVLKKNEFRLHDFKSIKST